MHTFRAFAQGKATWILNYSWDGDKNVDPREAMKNLAMSQVMANANFWDAPGHSMAGSNDIATRTEIFRWIEANQEVLYSPRSPIAPVGVYFSPATRNLYADDFLKSYRGTLILLMQKHVEFQIVTPRTLAAFKGKVLVLPDVRMLDGTEQGSLEDYLKSGRTLVITGENAPVQFSGTANISRFPGSPGTEYYQQLEKSFATTLPDSQQKFLAALASGAHIEISASPEIATSISSVEGSPHIFFANFSGLKPHEVAVPATQRDVIVTVSRKVGAGHFLPFLGKTQDVQGKPSGDKTVFTLPDISRGAIFWFEEK